MGLIGWNRKYIYDDDGNQIGDVMTDGTNSIPTSQWKSGWPLSESLVGAKNPSGVGASNLTMAEAARKNADANPTIKRLDTIYRQQQDALDNPNRRYKCSDCGYTQKTWFEECPVCGAESRNVPEAYQ